MGRWLLAAAVALPLAAQADPAQRADPAVGLSGPERTSGQTYAPLPPAQRAAHYAGWGMRATIKGRSLDLASMNAGWAGDPMAGPRDIEAGYSWRGRAADAVLGYAQFDLGGGGQTGRFDTLRRHTGAGGVLGLTFVLHER